MPKGLRLDEQTAKALQERASKGWPRKPVPAPPSAARATGRSAKHHLEHDFANQLQAAGIRAPIRQFSPFPDRGIRIDFAWPVLASAYSFGDWKPGVAFEVQGMVHRIKERFKADARRHNDLVLAGWTVYYVTGDMIRDGSALKLAQAVLK
jgi:hypothetical protein